MNPNALQANRQLSRKVNAVFKEHAAERSQMVAKEDSAYKAGSVSAMAILTFL
jgi:hypothetical protein